MNLFNTNRKNVGITELYFDDGFCAWVDEQDDELLASMSTEEAFRMYKRTISEE